MKPFSNLSEMFYSACEKNASQTGVMYKKDGIYHSIKYSEIKQRVSHLAAGFAALGVTKGDKVILLSENRYEWIFCDYAILCNGAISVPVYPTLPPDQSAYIINDCDAKIVIVSTAEQRAKVESIQSHLNQVQHFIIMDDENTQDTDFTALAKVAKAGEQFLTAHPGFIENSVSKLALDDLATIIYTSGTTGEPKGVMLSHGNILSNIEAGQRAIPLGENEIALSFLPLSHSFERTAGQFTGTYCGGTIAYAESIETVAENLLEIRPTVMASVPRLFEKIYTRIIDSVEEGPQVKRKLFYWAVKTGRQKTICRQKKRSPSLWLRLKFSIADKLVFSKIKAKLGGRMKFCVSGGAPLAKEIGEFFTAIGLLILEGYGLTETSPIISVNRLDNFKFGTVGLPLDNIEVKIAEDGEILTRGPHVMQGYYNKEANTRAIIDDSGWLHTGDIGHFDQDGFLAITDRKKNLIVTAGGKNIAPQKMENLLIMSRFVEQALVIGDRRKFCSAIIVPNFEALEKYAKENEIFVQSRRELCVNPDILRLMQQEVDAVNQRCASFETIKKFLLINQPFSIESDELTPSMKVRRKIVEENYREAIDALYEESPVKV